jgi:propionyl-CoA carboxylase alpha chain
MNFRRMLIANRGEIAVRIMRTCRAMGIETVAVYSEFDRDALHVRMADSAVPIGPAAPRDSYLNIAAILSAAKRCGAEAIHPGYGFLAENAEFAAACEEAGIVFIGPRSSVIRAMGSKIEARRLAQEAGVPVVPEAGEKDFSKLGFPVLIKASAGGGGRGMRIVRQASEFQEAFAAARGETERAFGDGSLLVEKYVEEARHVEIQIFGDHHGGLMHLNERDCSVQRRHQKIIEESPSPALTLQLRERMGEAALRLAKKIGYTNAGTVEFLLAPAGEFYFIEVNTRIQVEHPVTEMLNRQDLIQLQIEIAQGGRLPEERPLQNGHAIEARLYAEDPLNNFLPSTGRLHVWEVPPHHAQNQSPRVLGTPGPPDGMDDVRVDSGVEAGTEIGVHYDPLLAKIIAHGADRETARQKLVYALKHFAAQGVETNREFLIDVLESEEFRAGRAHTGFQLAAKRHTEYEEVFAEVAEAYALHNERSQRSVLPSVPVRWGKAEGTGDRGQVIAERNHRPPTASRGRQVTGHGEEQAGKRQQATGHREEQAGHRPQATGHRETKIQILKVSADIVEALVDGVHYHFRVTAGCATQDSGTFYIYSSLGQRTVVRPDRFPRRVGVGERHTANSPMPGQVLRILVTEGQRVKAGDALIALEAMKMEQTIKAIMDGVVGKVLVRQGEIVAPGQKLVEIQRED